MYSKQIIRVNDGEWWSSELLIIFFSSEGEKTSLSKCCKKFKWFHGLIIYEAMIKFFKKQNNMLYNPQEKRQISKKRKKISMWWSLAHMLMQNYWLKLITKNSIPTSSFCSCSSCFLSLLSLSSLKYGRWTTYAELFVAAHTKKPLCMLWFFSDSFEMGVCCFLEDCSKKLSTSKVSIPFLVRMNKCHLRFLIRFFWSWLGGIIFMEEAFSIELRETRETGNYNALPNSILV